MKGDYEYFNALKAAKNKPNSKPIKANRRPSAGNPKLEIRNNLDGSQTIAPKAQLKGYDLKKQTQFLKGQINLNVCIERDYGDFHDFRHKKNKPNSKPNKANFLKIRLGLTISQCRPKAAE